MAICPRHAKRILTATEADDCNPEQRAIFEVLDLELRQRGGGRVLSPGGSLTARVPRLATGGECARRSLLQRAFAFAVEDEARAKSTCSAGHSFDKPAGQQAGLARLSSMTATDGLRFEADLPEEAAQPSWMRDTVMALNAGLVGGIIAGVCAYRPASAVPGAEELIPEPGNPGVQIRVIRQAVLFELSASDEAGLSGETEVDLRAEGLNAGLPCRSCTPPGVAVMAAPGVFHRRAQARRRVGQSGLISADELATALWHGDGDRGGATAPPDVAAGHRIERYSPANAPVEVKNEAIISAWSDG